MRVLLAVDQSPSSDAAIAFLARQEFAAPAELVIMSVIPPLPYVDVSGGGALGVGMIPDVGDFLAQEQQLIQSTLDATAEKLRSHFRSVQTVVTMGSPEREIRSYADSHDIDLVVAGAVGHSAVGRILLGSVSDYVATHVQASALVIRPAGDAEQQERSMVEPPEVAGRGGDLGLKRVLLAVGASEQDLQLVERLAIFKLPQATEIHLVHVAQLMTFFRQDLKEQASDFWLKSRVAALEHLNLMKEKLSPFGFSVSTELLSESHIGEALVVYAQEHDCDLILACDQRRSFLDRAVLGSTSRYLLRHAHRSVMIVRAPAAEQPSAS